MGSNVCDVRHPGFVWSLDIEPAIKRVVDGQRGLATIRAGTALVVDLGTDTRQLRQPRNTVWAARLAHIH